MLAQIKRMQKFCYPIFIGLFFISSLFPKSLWSQEYLIQTQQFSVEEGLSNRFVYSVIQDDLGFMWFGTKHGLNRYDGYQFKILTAEKDSLQSNIIANLSKDKTGLIWISHVNNNDQLNATNGVDILNPWTLEVKSFDDFFGKKTDIKEKDIRGIEEDINGNLVIITKKGKVFSYSQEERFQSLYNMTDSARVISKFIANQQGAWIHSNEQLLYWNAKTKILDTLIADNLYTFNQFNDKLFIYQKNNKDKDKDKDTPYEFSVFTSSLDEFSRANLKELTDTTLNFFIKGGNIKELEFILKRYNFFIKNKKGEKIFEYRPIYSFLRDIYIDVQGNIWLCTDGEILKIYFTKNKFDYYNKGKSCKAITHLDSNTLVVAAYEGFSITNLNNNKVVHPENHYAFLDYIQDSAQLFWAVKREPILTYFEIGKEPIKNYTRHPDLIKRDDVGWSLYQDEDRIWIGTNYGLAYLDKGAEYIEDYDKYGEFEELAKSIVYQIHVNGEKVWLATSSGLYLMNWKQGVQKKYSAQKNATAYIPHSHIQYVHEDQKGILWLATRGGGLIKLDPKTYEYQQFLQEDGLSNNLLYAILEVDNNLWISSDYGLMRFNKENNLVNTYLIRDGLLHNEFNLKSSYKAPDGKLFFGGLEGAIGFYPQNLSTTFNETSYDVPLNITSYQQFDGGEKKLLDLTLDMLVDPKITLRSQDMFFIIQFALLDYTNTKQNRYAYKIEGLEQGWNYLEENSIRINGLAAGKYTLHIKGQGKSGLWSTQQLKIPITVLQPFYKTWQFLFIVIGGIIFIIIVYARWKVVDLRKREQLLELEVKKRTAKIEQQAAELKELDNLKSKFFANVSHELRTPITLLLGPLEAILDEHYGRDFDRIKQVLKIVYNNGENLQKLIEELLQLSKLDANILGVQEDVVNLFSIVDRIQMAFATEAELRAIRFEFVYEANTELTINLDTSKFQKVLNNLLSNALKFTSQGGLIRLEVKQLTDKKELYLAVKDTGVGIDPKDLPYIFNRFYQSKQQRENLQGGAGIGLALAHRFVELFGGELKVTSQLEKGSIFSFSLPYQEAVLHSILEETTEIEIPTVTDNTTSDYTILIVEDNQDMRNFIESLLKPIYQTIAVDNGLKAWELLSAENAAIDLVLSDVMMPEMNGFELLQRIKEQHMDLPVVLLTALSSPQNKLNGLTIGADDYLTKPFSKKELMVRIKNLLNNYKQRQTWTQDEIIDTSKKIQKTETVVVDRSWIKEVETLLKKEVGNTQFGILQLAVELNISERQLRRRIKKFVGLTPNQYFRIIRLQVAKELLLTQKYETIAEVAHHIGFTNPQYFSKLYEEEYGKKPSEIIKNTSRH